MTEAQTIPAKYIFLDVVGFTHNRSVEAQSDIVHILNEIVGTAITKQAIPKEKLILLPTGDGLCIALLNVDIALLILKVLKKSKTNSLLFGKILS